MSGAKIFEAYYSKLPDWRCLKLCCSFIDWSIHSVDEFFTYYVPGILKSWGESREFVEESFEVGENFERCMKMYIIP